MLDIGMNQVGEDIFMTEQYPNDKLWGSPSWDLFLCTD